MRRALFGNGIPKRALVDDGTITVFDTNAFTPQEGAPQAFLVTLYAWAWQNTAPFGTATQLPDLGITLESNGGGAIAIAERFAADFAAFENAGITDVAKPVKLLDRLVLRGDQVLKIANTNADCSVANTMSCFIYGFFEMAGVNAISLPFRPLQPGALVKPFTAAPAVGGFVGPATGYVTAHQLSTAYLDALTLKVNVVESLTAYVTPPKAFARLPGGVKLPLPTLQPSALPGATAFVSNPFSGIPLLAPSSSDNLVEIGVDTNNVGDTIALAGYGDFRRG